MSLNVTLNGSVYIIPETGEVGWGGNTTSYLVAIAAGTLQKTGGSFTLSSEIDFGASFGLKSLYYKSRSANVAAAGILRLNNNSDSINWRNAANSADLSLFPNASNLLTFNGSTVYVIGAGTITNADIAAGAGIVYSKLNLSNSIVNADVNTAAAIAYSKLNLATSIVNADVSPSAAIVYSKLSLSNSIVNADVNTAAAIAYSKLNLSLSIVNADINAAAAIAFSKMAALTASRMLVSSSGGVVIPAAWSYDASDNLTTGVQDELRFQDAAGGEYVAFRAPSSVTTHTYDLPIAAGTAGQVLSWQAGGQLQWINATGTGTIASGTQFQLAYYAATGTTVSGLTLITASRALASDANGLPVAATTTAAELNFVSGVTSAIQTQLNLLAPKANPVFTGVLSSPLGSAASPTYTFTGDLDTGIFSAAANTINFSTGGTSRLAITTTDITPSVPIQLTDGSATVPSLTFNNDLNTGLYRVSADDFALVVNGAIAIDIGVTQIGFSISASAVAELNSARFRPQTDNSLQLGSITQGWKNIYLGDGTAALPAVSFSADNDTGIFRSAANSLDFATGGSSRMTLDTTQLATSIVFRGPSGSATAPTYAFTAEAGLGWYRGGAARMSLAFGTVEGAFFDGTTGVFGLSNNYNMQTNVGTAAAPGYSFNGDSDTGIYRSAANNLSFSTGGVVGLTLDSAQNLNISDGTAAAPALTFLNDGDTGLYRIGSNNAGFAAGGAKALEFGPTGSTNATTYTPLKFFGGGYGTNFDTQATTGVSTTATTIVTMSSDGGIFIVYGKQTAGGTAEFVDLVLCGAGSATVTTVGSNSVAGSPNTRTYSVSGSNLRVAMGANTYTTRVAAMLTL